ncbi:MAG: hypothetical protein ABI220_05345 [Candidatus Saccharimonadales bacterium]
MKNQNKNSHIKLIRNLALPLVAIALVVGVSGIFLAGHNKTDAQAPAKYPTGAAVDSQFSSTRANGWWQGATNMTSMALFHKYDCFVSVQHKSGTVDVASELQKSQNEAIGGGHTVTLVGSQTLSLKTTSGDVQYELQQASVTSPDGTDKLKGGQEFGFVQLSNGYLKVMGYCDTATQLPSTIPALESIKFDVPK